MNDLVFKESVFFFELDRRFGAETVLDTFGQTCICGVSVGDVRCQFPGAVTWRLDELLEMTYRGRSPARSCTTVPRVNIST